MTTLCVLSDKMKLKFNVWIMLLLEALLASSEKRVHLVHWEKSNPMFRIDNTDNVIDVNVGNTRWEYDQANFVCPQASSNQEEEKYIIYNVSKEEYDSCMVIRPSSRIVATCTKPRERLYFTITFRSFSPSGGLEFHQGQDYYFLTTSEPANLHNKFGGRCTSHNMKVIFKVANQTSTYRNKVEAVASTTEPQVFFDDKNRYLTVPEREDFIDENTIETAKKVVRDFQQYENQVKSVKQEASRMQTSGSSEYNISLFLTIFLSLLLVRL